MKNIFIILTILLTFVSCDTAVKSELQTGIIEGEDAKSLAVDGFNDAYLANDMTGQDALFTQDAVASVNGQEMSPSEMMEAFMGGREFYDNIENTDRAIEEASLQTGVKIVDYTVAPIYISNKELDICFLVLYC